MGETDGTWAWVLLVLVIVAIILLKYCCKDDLSSVASAAQASMESSAKRREKEEDEKKADQDEKHSEDGSGSDSDLHVDLGGDKSTGGSDDGEDGAANVVERSAEGAGDLPPPEPSPPEVAIPQCVKVQGADSDGELIYVIDRTAELEVIPQAPLREDASTEQVAEFEWGKRVRELDAQLKDQTDGVLRATNFLYIDHLVHVRGAKRILAVFVPPLSSSLSPSGVFVYDTTQMPDNRLWLFCGPDSTPALRKNGEKLLELMVAGHPTARIERIMSMTDAKFKSMIHQMGGHQKMMLTAKQAGDEFLYEVCFFKTGLNMWTIVGGEVRKVTSEHILNPSLSLLPDYGSAVIDCGDCMLYLYVSDITGGSVADDVAAAMQLMGQEEKWKGRHVFVFDKATVPPQLTLIFTGTGTALSRPSKGPRRSFDTEGGSGSTSPSGSVTPEHGSLAQSQIAPEGGGRWEGEDGG